MLILAVSYLPIISYNYSIEKYRDIIIGVITIISFLFNVFLSKAQTKYLIISNTFREFYDCQVLEIEENSLLVDHSIIRQYIHFSKKKQDKPKYKVWYEEIFSDDDANNTLCCQMDNVIYTYYVYKSYKKLLLIIPVVLGLLLLISLFCFGTLFFFLLFFTFFNFFKVYTKSFPK